MNLYYCSDGTRVSENNIHGRLNRSYRKRYQDQIAHRCEGCGTTCNGSAHIIAKARCKVIHKTELIWDERNYFPACNRCNQAIENPKGNEWKSLKNIDYCLEFIKEHDTELYSKFMNNL